MVPLVRVFQKLEIIGGGNGERAARSVGVEDPQADCFHSRLGTDGAYVVLS